MNPLIAGIVLLVALAVWIAFAASRIAHLRNRTRQTWLDIETQLQRRWELIPTVVDAVRDSALQEPEIFDRIEAALARAALESSPRALAQAEEGLKEAMKALFGAVASHRTLQEDQRFAELAQALEQIEDAVQRARKHYNTAVRNYNTEIQAFPKSFLANLFGHRDRQLYATTDDTERSGARAYF